MGKISKDLVLFSGYAKLPTGITASEMYKVIGIIVVVNMKTGIIMEADCTLATTLARRHVSDLMLDYDLNDGPENLQNILENNYQGSAKKAVTTAVRIIYDKFKSYRLEEGKNATETI